MAELSSKLRSLAGDRIAFRCPGCNETHQITVMPLGIRGDAISGPKWSFNGNFEKPTFKPSVLVTWNEPSDVEGEFDDESKDKQFRCHSFVTDGRIQFLSDCTHSLAGQTVDLPDWESA